jgi:hypothetical protein
MLTIFSHCFICFIIKNFLFSRKSSNDWVDKDALINCILILIFIKLNQLVFHMNKRKLIEFLFLSSKTINSSFQNFDIHLIHNWKNSRIKQSTFIFYHLNLKERWVFLSAMNDFQHLMKNSKQKDLNFFDIDIAKILSLLEISYISSIKNIISEY